ncbi:hypothetical protein FOA43_000297 [Brettanomyces nanus]|uniref:Uncharacterized protein n=1 Tax=Eeniella nana TaxID=13502 RepID=A0A875RWW0_EENNA|nr:uncharacterized protein FOA43_000297 [Brettanomyces nanus]QPG72993.1 hypothetical protein FOA43_000297 [Brettanomyces nanus]
MFQWIFGKRLTPQEQMRRNQRQLEKTQRELEREKMKLQQQEKQLIRDIKKNAKVGQVATVKVQAKDLIRTRKQMVKFDRMKTQIQAISLRLQTMRSSTQMTTSMKSATRILSGLNGNLNLNQLGRITQEFQKSMDVMDQKQEMVDDVMDDMMDDELEEDDEEEVDEVVNQVLDEVGVGLHDKLGESAVPEGGIESKSTEAIQNKPQLVGADGGSADDDLQARLDSLKR